MSLPIFTKNVHIPEIIARHEYIGNSNGITEILVSSYQEYDGKNGYTVVTENLPGETRRRFEATHVSNDSVHVKFYMEGNIAFAIFDSYTVVVKNSKSNYSFSVDSNMALYDKELYMETTLKVDSDTTTFFKEVASITRMFWEFYNDSQNVPEPNMGEDELWF